MIDMRNLENAGHYRVILADPPWKFRRYSKAPSAKAPDNHYPVSSIEALGALPSGEMATRDAWLFMWSTAPHLQEAFELARLWSDPANPWTYRTFGAWAKRPRGWRGDPAIWQMGTGYIFRSCVEPLLVFGRGSPAILNRSERNLWVEPIRAHSQKPEAVRNMIRRLTEGPRLELFAADLAAGFDPWGMGHHRKDQEPGRRRGRD